MDKRSVEAMIAAVEMAHGGRATLVDYAGVVIFEESVCWSGIVYTFSLADQRQAHQTAYAWMDGNAIRTEIPAKRGTPFAVVRESLTRNK